MTYWRVWLFVTRVRQFASEPPSQTQQQNECAYLSFTTTTVVMKFLSLTTLFDQANTLF